MESKKLDRAASRKQQPEALAQFAESARQAEKTDAGKPLYADSHTIPSPASNSIKHGVATELLNEGAHGEKVDPPMAGMDALPDRIVESRAAGSGLWGRVKDALSGAFSGKRPPRG